jgi:hypothetical protein
MYKKVLAASQCRDNEAHIQAFSSATDKRSCQMATLLATYDEKVAHLYNAWMVSQDSAKAKAAKCAVELAESALAKTQCCHESTECAVALSALALAKGQTLHVALQHAAVLAERCLADARCC